MQGVRFIVLTAYDLEATYYFLIKAGIRELSFSLCTIGTCIGTKPGHCLMTAGRLVSYTCNSEQGISTEDMVR